MIQGIEVGHIIGDAETWWDTIGADRMRYRSFSNSTIKQQNALNNTDPGHPNYLGNSGILKGYRWRLLSPDEKYRVIKAYVLTVLGHSMELLA